MTPLIIVSRPDFSSCFLIDYNWQQTRLGLQGNDVVPEARERGDAICAVVNFTFISINVHKSVCNSNTVSR